MINSTLISILGPTSSGKSEMAIELANYLGNNTWIINCDSRQIYKNLNIGTGKVDGEWKDGIYYYKNIKHFLIDYVDPSEQYSLKDYLIDFNNLFTEKSTIPKYIILTGGTGLYSDSIISNYELPLFNKEQEDLLTKTKNELNKKSLPKLQEIYNSIQHKSQLNQSDYNNPRRLVNNIIKNDPRLQSTKTISIPQFQKKFNFAIHTDPTKLREKISTRLQDRFISGLVDEVKNSNLPQTRLNELGLEYKIVSDYLKNPENNQIELIQKLINANLDLAKRQKTWLAKRDLIWIDDINQIIDYLNKKQN